MTFWFLLQIGEVTTYIETLFPTFEIHKSIRDNFDIVAFICNETKNGAVFFIISFMDFIEKKIGKILIRFWTSRFYCKYWAYISRNPIFKLFMSIFVFFEWNNVEIEQIKSSEIKIWFKRTLYSPKWSRWRKYLLRSNIWWRMIGWR